MRGWIWVLASALVVFMVVDQVSTTAARVRRSSFSAPPADLAQFVLQAMNLSVDPCADFYNYSCGNWIANTPLPPDASTYPRSIGMIGDHNNQILLDIVSDPSTGKVNTFWAACMNVSSLTDTGLYEVLDFINGVKDVESLMETVGRLHVLGISSPLFSWGVTIDAKNTSFNIAEIDQGGINLPDPTMYEDAGLMTAYHSHISTMFQLAGFSAQNASQSASQVIALEKGIAAAQAPEDQLLDPFVTYNKLSISELSKQAPALPWTGYLKGIGFPNITEVNVQWPAFLTNMSNFVASQPANTWKAYLQYSALNSLSALLTPEFLNATFNFYGKVLYGLEAPPPRWEFCITETDGAVGDLLGNYYAQLSFGAKALNITEQMVLMIEQAMTNDLETVSWMDETTRSRALDKIGKMANLIGYPANPNTYPYLKLRSDEFFYNSIESRVTSFLMETAQAGQPSDRNAWQMTADTVNAYYDPTRNEMVFPAGIMQTPYFNDTWPAPMNFGGLGMIMGHECTHGFDDEGRDYDGTGRLVDWWTAASSEQFNERVQCVINQYSQYEVLPGVYVNGNLTQGENIADMGGIKNAYYAYKSYDPKGFLNPSIVPGLNNVQLFFVAYAQGWCEVATPQALELQVKTDVHSPARYRVIGPLQDFPEFSAAFQCPVGSYMNPPNRCEVW